MFSADSGKPGRGLCERAFRNSHSEFIYCDDFGARRTGNFVAPPGGGLSIVELEYIRAGEGDSLCRVASQEGEHNGKT